MLKCSTSLMKSRKVYHWIDVKQNQKSIVRNIQHKNKKLMGITCYSEPFILALLICGISVKQASKTLVFVSIVIRLTFVLCISLTSINTLTCLLNEFRTFYLLTLATKMVVFICWIFMNRNAENFTILLRIMEILQKKNKNKSMKSVTILGRTALLIFVAIILIPSIRAAVRPSTSRTTCHEFWLTLSGIQHSIYHFFISMARQFANWSVPYSATLFYSLYCIELSNKTKSFCKKSQIHSSFQNLDLTDCYDIIRAAILKLEDSLSLAIFFVLFTNFFEMFRVLTLIIFMNSREQTLHSFVQYGLYFIQTSLLFLVLVFSADSIQVHFNSFRKHILGSPYTLLGEKEQVRFRKKLVMIEDGEYVTLTSWGVFEIKRTLILSAIASLITYGVLLQQFKQ